MTNAKALARAAEAMLRALGGTEVKLRCPVAAAKEEQARQLGLEAPVTEDILIAPVVARPRGEDIELLIAPSSVARYMQDRGQTAEQFFEAVLAILHGARELRVKSFAIDHFGGDAYLFRITAVAEG